MCLDEATHFDKSLKMVLDSFTEQIVNKSYIFGYIK